MPPARLGLAALDRPIQVVGAGAGEHRIAAPDLRQAMRVAATAGRQPQRRAHIAGLPVASAPQQRGVEDLDAIDRPLASAPPGPMLPSAPPASVPGCDASSAAGTWLAPPHRPG